MKKVKDLNKRAVTTKGSERAMQRSQGREKNQTLEPRTILVPVDFSKDSQRALDVADSLARKFNAAISLVHVLDPIYKQGRFDSPRLRPLRAEALEDAKAELAKLAHSRTKESQKTVKHHVIDGVAHAEIVDFARKTKVDWIVMGSKGRTGMKRLVAGSVAERVVRHAQCPVLIVP